MTLRDLLDHTSIAKVWTALGGGPLHHGRGKACWWDGDGDNISLDGSNRVWYDHAHGKGGGVLALIETALDCDRRGALRWLADHLGVELDGQRPLTREEKRAYAIRRAEAERKARKLTAWRRNRLRDLRDDRNPLYTSENAVSAVARVLLKHAGPDDEAAWSLIWQHAFDNEKADAIQAKIKRIEATSPVELYAEMKRAA